MIHIKKCDKYTIFHDFTYINILKTYIYIYIYISAYISIAYSRFKNCICHIHNYTEYNQQWNWIEYYDFIC